MEMAVVAVLAAHYIERCLILWRVDVAAQIANRRRNAARPQRATRLG
jgi:hypothetical protein